MIAYVTRKATPSDMAFLQLSCEQMQADYWDVVGKAPVEWTPELRERIGRLTNLVALSRTSERVLVGTLIMDIRPDATPPSVRILGMATARTLPHEQRVGVGLSLLIGGYPFCKAARVTRGFGTLEASNAPLLEVFQRVVKFRIRVAGREAPKPMLTERKPHVYAIEVEPLDDDYLEALKAALAEL